MTSEYLSTYLNLITDFLVALSLTHGARAQARIGRRIAVVLVGRSVCLLLGTLSAWRVNYRLPTFVHTDTTHLSSQYIFMNMFTGSPKCPIGVSDTDAQNPGVVVENFSYVFQLTGGAKSITRDEIRAFKKAWAKFANPKTQHLERNRFVPFFAVCLLIFLFPHLTHS